MCRENKFIFSRKNNFNSWPKEEQTGYRSVVTMTVRTGAMLSKSEDHRCKWGHLGASWGGSSGRPSQQARRPRPAHRRLPPPRHRPRGFLQARTAFRRTGWTLGQGAICAAVWEALSALFWSMFVYICRNCRAIQVWPKKSYQKESQGVGRKRKALLTSGSSFRWLLDLVKTRGGDKSYNVFFWNEPGRNSPDRTK